MHPVTCQKKNPNPLSKEEGALRSDRSGQNLAQRHAGEMTKG